MNIFFVFKDEIITPKLDGSILAGVTRETVIDLLLQKSQPVVERKISINELMERVEKKELLEAFGTGTAAVISPIGSFRYQQKEYSIGSSMGELSSSLKSQICKIQRGQCDAPQGWVELIV